MSSDRRVFVLGATGEVGPFTVDDLRRELVAGRIHRADQIRTATGKVLGTVGDLVGGVAAHVHVSGRMPSAGSRSERQRVVEPRHASASPPAAPSPLRWLPVVGVVVALAVFGAVWALRSPAGVATPPVTPVAVATVPQVRLTAVTATADAKSGTAGLIRITSDVALSVDLSLQIQVSGTATQADIQTLPIKVTLPAGKTVLDLPVLAKPASSERIPARQVQVRLMPGTGYILGGGINATITLVSSAVTVISTLPATSAAPALVAFEDFAPRDPYTALGGQGWNGPWLGTGMEFLAGSLNDNSGKSHARMSGSKQVRRLSKRVSSGSIWLSYVANDPEGGPKIPQGECSPWSAMGPFSAGSMSEAFTTEFIAEQQAIDLAQEQRGLRWIAHPEWRDGEIIQLSGENSANYVYRTITVPAATTLHLKLGSDDGLSVWVNGERLLAHNIDRNIFSQPDLLTVHLKPGRNALLMKVVNGESGTSFYFRGAEPGQIYGLSLFDSAQETLFVGHSSFRQGLSVEYPPHPEQQFMVLPGAGLKRATRLVVRLDLAGDHTDASWWIDPPAGAPPTPIGTLRMDALALDQVRFMVDPGLTWEVADLRLGTSWDDVVPH